MLKSPRNKVMIMKSMKLQAIPMKTFAKTFSLNTLLISAALGLAACASSTGGNTGTANPQAERITDERILAERKALDGLQTRLKVLNDAGVPVKSYTHAKAQCWLDSAKTQYHENDRTGYVEEAMEQSTLLIRSLETDKTKLAGNDTPLIAKSDKVRDDLWARFATLKGKPGFSCVEQIVACNEVRLVRAGHANQQTGWRQASPHIAMVEDALKVAEREEAACKVPSVVAVPKAPAAPPAASPAPVVVAPAAPTVTTRRLAILADALFHYDQYSLQHMLPEGKSRLREAAASLQTYSRIDQIGVYGYTDRVGSDQYNQTLSQRRADTVKAYLRSLGVNAPVFVSEGRGKSLSKSDECRRGMPLKQLAPCLQADRKVEIEVTGILQ
jgi:OmpA-OmpF porin, OOP family